MDYKSRIDKELNSFFDRKIRQASAISGEAVELVETAKKFVLAGGKRIRPMLAILGYKAFSGSKEDDIIKASAALELIHAFLLIHDDIMDFGEERHSIKTVHRKYRDEYDYLFTDKGSSGKAKEKNPEKEPKQSPKASHFGESVAICIGDMTYAYANEIIANSNFNEKLKSKALAWISSVVTSTCFGQIHDIFAGEKKYEYVPKKEIELIHYLKTARYSAEGPLVFGAVLAGASEKSIAELRKIAIPIGMAFQLQDDILNLFSDNGKMGKDCGSDLKERKKTMLILKAMENGESDELLNLLNKRELTQKDVQQIKDMIQETSSLDYSNLLIGKLIGISKMSIRKASIREEAKLELLSLMDRILKRES